MISVGLRTSQSSKLSFTTLVSPKTQFYTATNLLAFQNPIRFDKMENVQSVILFKFLDFAMIYYFNKTSKEKKFYIL